MTLACHPPTLLPHSFIQILSEFRRLLNLFLSPRSLQIDRSPAVPWVRPKLFESLFRDSFLQTHSRLDNFPASGHTVPQLCKHRQ